MFIKTHITYELWLIVYQLMSWISTDLSWILSGQMDTTSSIDYISSVKFDFTTIQKATSNFLEANMVGRGHFGAVYKVNILALTVIWLLTWCQMRSWRRMGFLCFRKCMHGITFVCNSQNGFFNFPRSRQFMTFNKLHLFLPCLSLFILWFCML